MPRSLNTTQPDFDAAFAAFLARARGAEADVSTAVATIIAEVKLRGDGALFDYTKRFDRFALTADNLRVRASEVAEAKAAVPPEALAALKVAAERIEAFHCRHKPRDDLHTDETGVTLGARWTPVDAAGLYVPGGLAAYPSSVLMNAIPAKIAGLVPMTLLGDGLRLFAHDPGMALVNWGKYWSTRRTSSGPRRTPRPSRPSPWRSR